MPCTGTYDVLEWMHVASNIILSEVEPAILFQHVLSTDRTLHEIEFEFEFEFEFVLIKCRMWKVQKCK